MKLSDSVNSLPFVGPVYVKRLKRLGISSVEDLLYHVPTRYIDYRNIAKISDLSEKGVSTTIGKIDFIKNQYTKTGKKIQIAQVSDATGSIKVIWFNQPFLARALRPKTQILLAGEISWFGSSLAYISPEYEVARNSKTPVHTARLVPIYPETAGVSSKWLRGRIAWAFKFHGQLIVDFLPDIIQKEMKLINLKKAIKYVHFPKRNAQIVDGKKRLAFDELLYLQLKSLYRKQDWQKNKANRELVIDKKLYKEFESNLPFDLTKSQKRSVEEIFSDLEKVVPMNRLLEGDVGSGKTVVAAAAAFVSFTNGFQSIVMAPTQILAQQHFSTLKKVFDPFKIRVKLITSQVVKGDIGKTDVFVGTHALIHKNVVFDNVSLVVIDEQHRFGVEQRAHLITKSTSSAPHVLTMTATPIPRTAALTVYGDLDLSTLDELPKGRKPITTWLVAPSKREGAYKWMEKQIKDKNIQVFVICPLIEESEIEMMSQIKAVIKEYEKLKNIFSKQKVGLLHGRLKVKEKNDVVDSFKKGKIDILVSTPVVEVGIDVANATIMIIEAAERFGLAQLHQLRGRVGRGEEKSYCLLFTESRSPKVTQRLKALKQTLSGFELAELDLKLRGPGEVFGLRQHGFPELKVASWQDTKLLMRAKTVARDVLDNPKDYAKLHKRLESQKIAMN